MSRWGTCLAVRIPRPIAEQWVVRHSSAIEIVPQGDQGVLRKKGYDLPNKFVGNILVGNIDDLPIAGSVGPHSVGCRGV